VSSEESPEVKTISHVTDGIKILKESTTRSESRLFPSFRKYSLYWNSCSPEWFLTGMVAHKASGSANASESTDSDGMVAHQNG